MYFVVLFEINKPHISENAKCGFYSENLEDCLDFLTQVNYCSHEAVVCLENEEIDTCMSN